MFLTMVGDSRQRTVWIRIQSNWSVWEHILNNATIVGVRLILACGRDKGISSRPVLFTQTSFLKSNSESFKSNPDEKYNADIKFKRRFSQTQSPTVCSLHGFLRYTCGHDLVWCGWIWVAVIYRTENPLVNSQTIHSRHLLFSFLERSAETKKAHKNTEMCKIEHCTP